MRFSSVCIPLLLAFQCTTGVRAAPMSVGDTCGTDRAARSLHGALLLVPTATPLTAGKVVFSLHELFFPALGLGVTERLSVRAGASVVPGSGAGVVFLSPGFTAFRAEHIDIACGVWILSGAGGGGRGFGYANLTVTGARGSLTLGAGFGLNGGAEPRGSLWMGGASLQVTGETHIIAEVFLPPALDPAVVTLGSRITSGNLSVEFAVVIPWSGHGSGVVPLPWTSFSVGL